MTHIGRNPFEDSAMPPVLAQEKNGNKARRRDDSCGKEKRRGLPEAKEDAAADQTAAQSNPAKEVLHPLGPTIEPIRQQIRVEAPIRRLVDVVREEEREDEKRRRPEVRHERHQRKTESDRADGNEHEGSAAPHGSVERVTPGADNDWQR